MKNQLLSYPAFKELFKFGVKTMSNPSRGLKAVKVTKSVKLESNISTDKLDRDAQIRKKKLIDNGYPFEEHGL